MRIRLILEIGDTDDTYFSNNVAVRREVAITSDDDSMAKALIFVVDNEFMVMADAAINQYEKNRQEAKVD